MKRYKSKFEESISLDTVLGHKRLESIVINCIGQGSGLYKTSLSINGKEIKKGILSEDDFKILEKALNLIESKIE